MPFRTRLTTPSDSEFSTTADSSRRSPHRGGKVHSWREVQNADIGTKFGQFLERNRNTTFPDQFLVSKKKRDAMVMQKPKLRLNVLAETLSPPLIKSLKQEPPAGVSVVFYTMPANARPLSTDTATGPRFKRAPSPNTSLSFGSYQGMDEPKAAEPVTFDTRREVITNSQLEWFEWHNMDCAGQSINQANVLDDLAKKNEALTLNLTKKRKGKTKSRSKGAIEVTLRDLESLQMDRIKMEQQAKAVRKRPDMEEGDGHLAEEQTVLKCLLNIQQLQRTNMGATIPYVDFDELKKQLLSAKGSNLRAPPEGWDCHRQDFITIIDNCFPTLCPSDLSTVWNIFQQHMAFIDVVHFLLSLSCVRQLALGEPLGIVRFFYALMEGWQFKTPSREFMVTKLILNTVINMFQQQPSGLASEKAEVVSELRSLMDSLPWQDKPKGEPDAVPFYKFVKTVTNNTRWRQIMMGSGACSELQDLIHLSERLRKLNRGSAVPTTEVLNVRDVSRKSLH
eukprot:NODE_1379_length_1759_cov_110.802567_g1310_i0.p1 GENE.NODE_1379_length_1759_cov_110.802567_g1310_i0~~NODE_1379_length_1759_cov_110.802567_g1310_i0.p1  ORF type:complete len:507 (+),score=79.96 NODE_1379_length_1759_cov_110.802567_g1310_i0:98-1618(+)